jgi:hypothetical protein
VEGYRFLTVFGNFMFISDISCTEMAHLLKWSTHATALLAKIFML